MPIIILIPTVICILTLYRGTVQQAFFNIYIPIFMLFPIYFWWKIAALPPIDVAEAVLLPLGIAILLRERHRWRFSLTDLWLAVFLFTTWFADYKAGLSTHSTFDLFSSLITCGVPYMAGKLLIEQPRARIATVKRIVFLLVVVSVIGAYEYRMGQNPFTLIWARFFPGEDFAWKTQIRWGWGRVSGPYGQSELAGLILFFGLILTLYLSFYKLWEPKFARARWLPGKKSKYLVWTLGLTLLMTQARGPWLGCLLALPIAFIGRSRNTRRSILIVLALILIAAPITYAGFKAYVGAAPTADQSTEDRQSAAYRSQMIDGYLPIAVEGGAFGWGQHFPRLKFFDSIDNEYLFVALTQGWVGLAAFSFICLHTLYNFTATALFAPDRRDRSFGWSMTGIFAGFLFTIFTVYLGNQPFQLFFLLAGWSQAMRLNLPQFPEEAGTPTSLESRKPKFTFEHVYT